MTAQDGEAGWSTESDKAGNEKMKSTLRFLLSFSFGIQLTLQKNPHPTLQDSQVKDDYKQGITVLGKGIRLFLMLQKS